MRVLRKFTLTLMVSTLFFGGCTGLFNSLSEGITNSLKDMALNAAFDQVKTAAESEGGTAVLIRNFDKPVSATITDKTSAAFGAAISLPAGAITAEVDSVILSIQPVPGKMAPRNLTDEAVGPVIDFRLQPAGLDGNIGGEISKLAHSARLSLPFSADAVTKDDVPFAARLKTEKQNLVFEKLEGQKLDDKLYIVYGLTDQLSQYAATAEHPLAPPAPDEIAGLSKESGYSSVSSGVTELCRSTYANAITLNYVGPLGTSNGTMTIKNDGASSGLLLSFGLSGGFIPPKAPLDLSPLVVDTPSNFSVNCEDSATTPHSVSSTGPTKTYNGLQIVEVNTTSSNKDVVCPDDSTRNCTITKGTMLVYWDISATDMNNATYSGVSRAYRTVDFTWTEFLTP